MDDSINIFSVGFACEKLTEDGGVHMVAAANGEPWDFFRPGDKVVVPPPKTQADADAAAEMSEAELSEARDKDPQFGKGTQR